MSSLTNEGKEGIKAVFDRHLELGLHHGAQLAVYVDEELVIDFAGGTDPDGREVTPERRHVIFSCTKPYVGVALHRLVEDGYLDYDDRVVDHWPEFADEGSEKAEITVRQVLSHNAGIPFGEFDERPDLWGDWDTVVEAMEEIEPVFPPGEKPSYHALNFGWLVGELIRRISGQPVEEYTAEQVFRPLGMDNTTIGLRENEDLSDTAPLAGFDFFDRCRDPGDHFEEPPDDSVAAYNEEAFRHAVIPGANGIGTAGDLARFYAAIANGGKLDEVRVLEEDTVEEALRVHAETEDDGTIDRPMRYSLGFWKGGHAADVFNSALNLERHFGHAGLGSVFGWGDPKKNVGFAYVTNGIREESFEHSARVNEMTNAVRIALRK